ncbi:MAG TPA: cell division protein FtsZ, partial [Solirubrobacterales bacterium]|nr:cell division protein FtsZ [Solirubrobacterales bacterium]
VSGGASLSLHDAGEIADVIREAADPDCNIIFGATVDEALGDQVWVTVVATRFDGRAASTRRPAAAEPTIRRTRDTGRGAPARGGRSELDTLDVPEFLPG